VILVRKRAPPPALTTYRLAPDTSTDPPRPARYDGPGFESVKPAIRDALVAEQRGVCCYCTDRIAATDEGMKIEHHVPQRGQWGDAARDLDWSNLLGACCGSVPNPNGRGAMVLHCDSAKGDRPLPVDPTDPAHVAAIDYTRRGHVTSTREEHQRSLDEVLNLNADSLVERRRRALDALQRELVRRYGAGSLPAKKLDALLAQIREPQGPLRPFAGYLAWWVERARRKAAP
jgi:uncharacterized protein (TIGR02646 family)